ncbi:NAD-dependent epimerase/dehydratase family protein [Agromyces larvae]|uniref:NAD(P)-dependent oxidoreductase n=1 Tax=Agromyces larvae TaxID=2929802 RepID=A0ABY4C6K6_9MICO|nr:NAD(P)-dependent oxidoreductase [Agromyces larvae]UOE45716.1 NAD(P)-dependent oxidoreductase [Agromyces larvae]
MRILVAGATGVLGSRVLPRLVADGHDVFGTTRSRARFPIVAATGARPIAMDAFEADSVAAAIGVARPDAIVHLLTDLAARDFANSARLRVEGTANLVDAALAAGVERMVAESISWVGEPGDEPAAEDVPFAVDRASGAPAYAAVESLEREIARMPRGTVLRYGLLYGAGTWYAADGPSTRDAGRGAVRATTDRTSWVHADDAAAATVLALGWEAAVVHVADDEPTRLAEWGPVLARRAGFAGDPELGAAAPGRAVDNALARSLGWTPAHPDWRDGLGLG